MIRPEDLGTTFRDRPVSRIRRILYENAGSFHSDKGPIELTLMDHGSLLLQPASDGETLAIREGAWADPFSPPLSPENAEFVRTHGKWTAVDVSTKDPFRSLVGAKAELVRPVLNPAGGMVGMAAVFGRATLRVDVHGDELVVEVVEMDTDR
jgi:hypothetical protein